MINDGLKAFDEMMLFYSDNSQMMFLNHHVQWWFKSIIWKWWRERVKHWKWWEKTIFGHKMMTRNSKKCPKLLRGKGNHPSKFQLAGVSRLGGIREHPNTQTHSLTHSLTDWCFDREILLLHKVSLSPLAIGALIWNNFCKD